MCVRNASVVSQYLAYQYLTTPSRDGLLHTWHIGYNTARQLVERYRVEMPTDVLSQSRLVFI